MITTKAEEIKKLAEEFSSKSAGDVIGWALQNYHPNIAISSSFGAEDVVVIDLAWRINPKIRVVTLDTGRLNQETYVVMDHVRKRYDIQIEVFFPDTAKVENMVRKKGLNLFYESIENRKECCHVRKVEPLQRALKGLHGWITGLRRQQAVTRTNLAKIELDQGFGNIVKVNPIVDWSRDDVWNYIKQNKVPYNALHDQGYPSIGCAPCTRPVKPGEDERAGRWWWELPEHKECGLHVKATAS